MLWIYTAYSSKFILVHFVQLQTLFTIICTKRPNLKEEALFTVQYFQNKQLLRDHVVTTCSKF